MENYSAEGLELPVVERPCVVDLSSLYARLEQMQDKRKARGKRYPLAFVLGLAIVAKLCGEDTPTGMADWAKKRAKALLAIFGIQRKETPAHNTFRRLLRDIVDVQEWQEVVSHFLGATQPVEERLVVSIDGKTVCGSLNQAGNGPLHLLAAYWPEAGVVLLQVAVEKKRMRSQPCPVCSAA